MPVMTEVRTRETSHGGKSVNITKGGGLSDNPPKMSNMSMPELQPRVRPEIPIDFPEPTSSRSKSTKKALNVNRVAKRLGWVSTGDPDEAIKILTKEAEKMKENVYKYLDSLAKLGENYCHEENPECIKCPMKESCKYRASYGKKAGFFRKK